MLRMLMGKSRENLAEALGVSPARIEAFESGFAIGASVLAQLSDELNAPPAFFRDDARRAAYVSRTD